MEITSIVKTGHADDPTGDLYSQEKVNKTDNTLQSETTLFEIENIIVGDTCFEEEKQENEMNNDKNQSEKKSTNDAIDVVTTSTESDMKTKVDGKMCNVKMIEIENIVINEDCYEEEKKKSMEEMVEELCDIDLKVKLINIGIDVAPITPTTRKIYKRILLRKLTGVQSGEVEQNGAAETDTSTTATASKPQVNISSAPDGSQILTGNQMYFAIAVPSDSDEFESPAEERIFTSKQDALRSAKKIKGARFKVFHTYTQSLMFAKAPADTLCDMKKLEDTGESSPFKGPRVQELTRLRRIIETGDLAQVRDVVWSNPRFLVSSCDTPVILQVGFRYNALHVAASKNQARMCSFVLDTLQDPEYMKLLYPQDSLSVRNDRIQHLLDLYLNMPDNIEKGNGEMPLHFACKFGHVDVVQVLTSHPVCDRTKRNKHGLTPEQVICSRLSKPDASLVTQIKELLDAQYYLPLLRVEDNSGPARVGEAWSPEPNQPHSPAYRGIIDPSNPLSRSPAQRSIINTSSPRDSPYTVSALAGPMSPQQLKVLRKQWLTPPSSSPKDVKQYQKIRRGDNEKGLERIGRKVAQSLGIPWTEYWEFLKSFVDLTTDNGLEKLESYLAEKYEESLRKQSLDLDLEELELKLSQFSLNSPPEKGNIEPKKETRTPFSFKVNATKEPSGEACQPEELSASASVISSHVFPKVNLGASPILKEKQFSVPVGDSEREQVFDFKIMFEDELDMCPQINNNNEDVKVTESRDQWYDTSESMNVETTEYLPVESNNGDATEEKKTNPGIGIKQIDCETTWYGDRQTDKEDDTESEVASYYTAAQSPPMWSDFGEDAQPDTPASSPNANFKVYLMGSEPSKVDVDVLRALEDTPVTPQLYPNITRWQHQLLSYSEESRDSWKSPGLRRQCRTAPRPTTPPAGARYLSAIYSPDSPSFDDVQSNLMSSFLSV